MSDKLVSPDGEQFQIAEDPGTPDFGQAQPDLFGDRTEPLWSTKEGDVFLYADAEGNLNPTKSALAGLYHRDTRFLSELMLLIDGRVPLPLSTSTERGFMSHIDLSKPDVVASGEGVATLEQTVNIRRTRVIRDRLYERVRLRSYHQQPLSLRVTMTFGADFADIFDVRGLHRDRRGRHAVPKATLEGIAFAYEGIDGEFRQTRICFDQPPLSCEVRGERVVAAWRFELAPGETQVVSFWVEPLVGAAKADPGRFDTASHELRRSYESWERDSTQVNTSNELYDHLLRRGRRDLRTLRTPTPHGDLIAAGIPWLVAPFGRDALLASHQFLMIDPELARSTLEVLAAYQGTEVDDWRDEEPGKIFHELRRGEVAGAGLLPHSPYYGSVDATPLWLLLLAAYWRWTADEPFCRKMLASADRALAWMDKYGDADGDGLIEYQARSPRGLVNHGWRHSRDAITHADGTPATGPIALAEVQGYAYMARQRMAELYEALGRADEARTQRTAAATLKRRFNEAFWVEDEQYLAMALDGDKRQVATVSSTPAHVLYCELVDGERAAAVGRRLLAPDMFSGWGIRTVSRNAPTYNPMSYHNGSIWPHDNAFVAAGLKRQGNLTGTNRVATALFDMAATIADMRLPELFCGFTRRTPNHPVAYPVACSPAATAAGAPFLILQAMLGISARAPENILTVNKPLLPPWLHTVELRNLKVGSSAISLVFTRQGETTGFSVIEKQGDVRVLMEE